MTPEKDKELCEKFPFILQNRNESPKTHTMGRGFSCSDGWFDIIVRMFEKIKVSNEGLPDDQKAFASQVKEKFGVLRVYMRNGLTEAVESAIKEAVKESSSTCEKCGDTETACLRTNRSWVKTLCDTCA